MERKIKIDSFSQVRKLQTESNKYDNIAITVQDTNGSVADAKSILGLMSLDYSRPVTIIVDDSEAKLMEYLIRNVTDEFCLYSIFHRLNPGIKNNKRTP